MLKTFVVVACVALVSAPALSQAYPRDEGRGSSYDRDYDRKDNMKDGRDKDHDDKHESVSGMSKSGAMFKIRIGEAEMKVKCDPSESMRSCVDAALALLEKARSLPTTNGPGTNSAGPATRP